MVLFLNEDVLLEILCWFVSVDEDGPFTIFFLSTKWREILLQSLGLWAWITVDASSPHWRERLHTSLMMSSGVPIYLSIKRPFPDLSTFGPAHFERARHLTIDAPDGKYLDQNIVPLLKRGYFGNVQQLLYLQIRRPAFFIANPSRVWGWGHHNQVWLVPENMLKVARRLPIRAFDRFDFEIDGARSRFLENADNFFASVMNNYLHIRFLTVNGDDLMEFMNRFRVPHRLAFPHLQTLVYKRRSPNEIIRRLDEHVKPLLPMQAPALERLELDDSFAHPTDCFRLLQLGQSYPFQLSFIIKRPPSPDARISVLQARCLLSVSTLTLNCRGRQAPLNPHREREEPLILRGIKECIDGLVAQMPRLSFVKVYAHHNMVDLFKALLPLPQSTSERSIRWHIEISHSLQPRNLDLMDPPTDIEIERLVLQVKKIPWAKLPQTHTIYVSLIEDVDYLLSAIDPPLNELRIGSQVQKLSKMQPLANITSLLSLTTLYSAAWFALRVLQSRSVPSLKRLTLLIYNSDPKANVAPLTPTARAEGRQEVDCVLEELGEYKEVSLEMIQFPSSPTWVTLCNLINTRYSEPGLQLALKLCELPCPVILRSLAAAFRGEYSFTQDPICQDHENETVVAPGDGGGEMPVHLTKDNLINYGYSGYPATYI